MTTRDQLLQERLNFATLDVGELMKVMVKLRDARPNAGTEQERMVREIEASLNVSRYWADKMLKDYGSPR